MAPSFASELVLQTCWQRTKIDYQRERRRAMGHRAFHGLEMTCVYEFSRRACHERVSLSFSYCSLNVAMFFKCHALDYWLDFACPIYNANSSRHGSVPCSRRR